MLTDRSNRSGRKSVVSRHFAAYANNPLAQPRRIASLQALQAGCFCPKCAPPCAAQPSRTGRRPLVLLLFFNLHASDLLARDERADGRCAYAAAQAIEHVLVELVHLRPALGMAEDDPVLTGCKSRFEDEVMNEQDAENVSRRV